MRIKIEKPRGKKNDERKKREIATLGFEPDFKDTFEGNSSNEYFKTISHYFRVYSLSGFM